ncbi:MAG TPA: hypothetical protein VE404_07350 [Verrucomicrobiae bacterium]|nr:hypothetical protein [Verrucomicrobiae bacterium]
MKLIQFRSPETTPVAPPETPAAGSPPAARPTDTAARALQAAVLRRVLSGQRYLQVSSEAHRERCASRSRAALAGAGPVLGESDGRHMPLTVTPIGGPAGYGAVALADLVGDSDARRIALLGGPGSGKSTLMWLAARRVAESAGRRPVVPVVFALKSFQGVARTVGVPGIAQRLTERILREISSPPYAWTRNDFLKAASNGWCVFFFDGLDELDAEDARVVVPAIAGLARAHPECGIVASARTASYRGAVELRDFKRFEVEPVDPLGDDAAAYLSGIGSVRDHVRGFRQMLEFEAPIRAALSTPLRLLIAALIYRDKSEAIPEERVKLYRDALEWIESPERRRTPQEQVSQWLMLSPEACLRSLAVLATKAGET